MVQSFYLVANLQKIGVGLSNTKSRKDCWFLLNRESTCNFALPDRHHCPLNSPWPINPAKIPQVSSNSTLWKWVFHFWFTYFLCDIHRVMFRIGGFQATNFVVWIIRKFIRNVGNVCTSWSWWENRSTWSSTLKEKLES